MSLARVRYLSLLSLALVGLLPSIHAQEEGESAPPPPAGPTPFKQVQMHVWISETSEQGLKQLGTNLVYKRIPENRGSSLQQINSNVFDPLDPTYTVTLPAPDQSQFLPPLRPDQLGDLANGVQTQSGGGLTFSIAETNHGTYEGVFRAIDQSTDIDLISKPELLVIDTRSAEIHAGGEIPFQTIAFDKRGNPKLQVTFKPVGVEMKITPTIGTDNLIRLDIEKLDVTDIVRVDKVRGLDLPVIAKRSQTGMVLVPNGQALVIGGLSSQVQRSSERRVPIVGKIPIIGALFRSRSTEVHTTNLMIFVAPTVVDLRNLSEEATNAMRFWEEGSWVNQKVIEAEMILMDSEF
jgi:type II secretory pathway component GspD/PulD (secretin)